MGNAAAEQRQLDVYGELFQTCWLYTRAGGKLDADLGRRLAGIADLVCQLWREPDSGIWEVRSEPVHFAVEDRLLDSAAASGSAAREGQIPARGADRWRAEMGAIRKFVEDRCWSDGKQSYVRFAGARNSTRPCCSPS